MRDQWADSMGAVWLGCSDSRVPETTILGLQPGDVFVHRNIANIINPTDISFNSVLEYAVIYLGVKHIVLCGHTACGGAAAALGGQTIGGVLDAWLSPLRMLAEECEEEIEAAGDSDADKGTKLAELNVEKGVNVLLGNSVVRQAVKERGLRVHGVIYDIAQGKVRDLECGNLDKKSEEGKGKEL
jgi:carbonic anhydrase